MKEGMHCAPELRLPEFPLVAVASQSRHTGNHGRDSMGAEAKGTINSEAMQLIDRDEKQQEL